MNIVGQQVKRVDAYGKGTGEAKYTADLEPETSCTVRSCTLPSPTAWSKALT